MSWRRPVFGGIGLAAVLFGIGLLLVPAVGSLAPIRVALRYVEAAGTLRILLLTGGGVLGYLLVGLRSPDGTGAATAVDRFEPAAPEQSGPQEGVSGWQLDRQVRAAVTDGGEPFADVRERLRQTAASVYADAVGCSGERARRAVERGEWCSDPLVEAFLSESDGPSMGAQVRLFVFPRRERRRRIERTVAVIERVQGR